MPGKRVSDTKRALIIRQLAALVRNGKPLTNQARVQIAETHGISQATVKRIYSHFQETGEIPTPEPAVTSSRALTVGDKRVIAAYGGNRRAAWEHQRNAGKFDKGYRTFLHRFDQLDPIERIGLQSGAHAAVAAGLKSLQIVEDRNDVWHYDHTEADIWVHHRNKLARPFITVFLDAATRMIVGFLVTFGVSTKGDPVADGIISAICEAMVGWEGRDGRMYGGVPSQIVYDNALAHHAEAIRNGGMALHTVMHPIPKASPWFQGKVEAVVDTITQELIVGLPGASKVLLGRHGLPAVPNRAKNRPVNPDRCLTLKEFEFKLNQWIDHYNFERKHSALGDLTPAEAWNLCPRRVEFADPNLVRHMFLAGDKPRVVDRRGVALDGIWFTHPDLAPHLGSKVTIRYLPNVRTSVDCYTLSGELICTATPHEHQTPEARKKMRRHSENAAARVTRWTKEGRREIEEQVFAELREADFIEPPERSTDCGTDGLGDDFLDLLEARLEQQEGNKT